MSTPPSTPMLSNRNFSTTQTNRNNIPISTPVVNSNPITLPRQPLYGTRLFPNNGNETPHGTSLFSNNVNETPPRYPSFSMISASPRRGTHNNTTPFEMPKLSFGNNNKNNNRNNENYKNNENYNLIVKNSKSKKLFSTIKSSKLQKIIYTLYLLLGEPPEQLNENKINKLLIKIKELTNTEDINYRDLDGNTSLLLVLNAYVQLVIDDLSTVKNRELTIYTYNELIKLFLENDKIDLNDDLIINKLIDILIEFKDNEDREKFLSIIELYFSKYPPINENLLNDCFLMSFKNNSNILKKTKDFLIDIINTYVLSILTNFEIFQNYIEKNKLFNTNPEKLFLTIFSHNKIDLYKNNFSNFLEYIINFIESLPESLKNMNKLNLNTCNIKNKSPDVKIMKLYVKFIFGYVIYLKKYYNPDDVLTPHNIFDLPKLRINSSSDELLQLLKMVNPASVPSPYKRFSIEYSNSIGANYGGLLRQFFSNIQKQLNKYFELEKKKLNESISIENLEEQYKSRGKIAIIQNKKLNNLLKLSNVEKEEKKEIIESLQLAKQKRINSIENIKKRINKLKININPLEEISVESQIKILAISKINKNPLFLNNSYLKKLILDKILKLFKKNIKKNIAYKLLLFDINDKMMINKSFALSNIDPNVSINNTFKNLKKINESIEDENFNLNLNLNNENISPEVQSTLNIIKQFIKDGIYKNFLDFYISHFVNFIINIDLLIERLNFDFSSNTVDTNTFIFKFKGLLRNLSEDEIKLFNECISGSFALQEKYRISVKVRSNNSNLLPVYHTCFSQMDISNMKKFEEKYLVFTNYSSVNQSNSLIIDEECKNRFVELLNLTLGQGFAIA